MLRVLLAKELMEQRRTAKLLVTAAVFLVTGMTSPVLARYMQEFLRLMPGIPEELLAMISEPTKLDALDQYIKNTAQFGVLLFVIYGMGLVTGEKERGTAAMLLTKPVGRSSVLLSKWLGLVSTLLVGVVLAGVASYYYTWFLFEALPVGGFVAMNLMLVVYLAVFISWALFASTIARTQTVAAGLAFGGMGLIIVLGMIPGMGDYLPGALLSWGIGLSLGIDASSWGALWVSFGLILVFLAGSCFIFDRQEI
jgi:ABC-2 type transport system permease protein